MTIYQLRLYLSHSKSLKRLNILQFQITVFFLNIYENVIYSYNAKINFQHLYCSLQCHMILHKSFFIKLKTAVLFNIFVEIVIIFFRNSLINKIT